MNIRGLFEEKIDFPIIQNILPHKDILMTMRRLLEILTYDQ